MGGEHHMQGYHAYNNILTYDLNRARFFHKIVKKLVHIYMKHRNIKLP
jgi:hypothetical protein